MVFHDTPFTNCDAGACAHVFNSATPTAFITM